MLRWQSHAFDLEKIGRYKTYCVWDWRGGGEEQGQGVWTSPEVLYLLLQTSCYLFLRGPISSKCYAMLQKNSQFFPAPTSQKVPVTLTPKFPPPWPPYYSSTSSTAALPMNINAKLQFVWQTAWRNNLSMFYLQTPMNQASTRSHCIFTIHISTRDPGSATIRRAKLHLVDLAG